MLTAEAEVQARVLLDAAFLHSVQTKELYRTLLERHNETNIRIRQSLNLIGRNVPSLDKVEEVGDVTNVSDPAKAQARLCNLTNNAIISYRLYLIIINIFGRFGLSI